MEISKLRKELERRKGQRDLLSEQFKNYRSQVRSFQHQLEVAEQTQLIIQKVAQLTQKELEYRVSEIVSLALASVFEDPYELLVDFVIKRGKTEAEISFVRNGQRIHPLSASGGGAVDVACFALRIALWSLQYPRTRATFILDEPFSHLSSDLQTKAGELLKSISEKLDVQMIVVTHIPDLAETANKVFTVSTKQGVSYVN